MSLIFAFVLAIINSALASWFLGAAVAFGGAVSVSGIRERLSGDDLARTPSLKLKDLRQDSA